MEYYQNDYYRIPDPRGQKLPFYLTYPLQNMFLEEAEYQRDIQRMKELYPQEIREIQEYVEEECDKLEYEGSMMFDEYPDRWMLRKICQDIRQKVEKGKAEQEAESDWKESSEEGYPLETEELRLVGRGRPPYGPTGSPPPPKPSVGPGLVSPLEQLIQVLLYNEMYQRRCRHKRCRRWW